MANGLGIDFNPEPAYGSNPFEPVQQGINLGLGLQREQRAGQEFEMQKRLQEEERKIREVERRNKSFQEGIGLLKDKKFLAGFPTELKNEVIRKKIAPYLTQDLGLPMDDSVTFKDVEPIMNEAINVFESSAPDDMKRQALMKLMARADPEERKEIQEIAEFGLGRSNKGLTDYQQAMIDLRREQMGDKKTEKVEKKQTAQNRVSQNLGTIAGLYQQLSDEGGIVDVEKNAIANIPRRISSSGIGQAAGRALGTKEQSIRNRINQIRPLLINDIRQASEMGARGLDSEKELEFYLQAATDPARDVQANLAAIEVLDRAYGLGLGIAGNGNVGGPASTSPVRVNSQAEYDALPSGSSYVDSEGNRARKP